MKPNTTAVMRSIIDQIRENFPFALSSEDLCAETCSYGCPLKLLEYMDAELSDWEARLHEGQVPTFGDIAKLTKTSRRIYTVLEKNHLVSGEIVSSH